MFEIKKSSWHYKLVTSDDPWLDPDDNLFSNLCPYMRRVIWILIGKACLWITLATIAAVVTVFLVIQPLVFLNNILFHRAFTLWGIFTHNFALIPELIIFDVIAFIVTGFMFYWYKTDDSRYKKRELKRRLKESLPPKEPSILWTYLVSLKEKTCIQTKVVD